MRSAIEAPADCETRGAEIEIGAAMSVGGGYDYEPKWLGGRDVVPGRVVNWIPGQNSQPACVVLLAEPLTAEGLVGSHRETVTGSHLVLELRYEGQIWEWSGTVHVELCASEPEPLKWGERTPGTWVESHATYSLHT